MHSLHCLQVEYYNIHAQTCDQKTFRYWNYRTLVGIALINTRFSDRILPTRVWVWVTGSSRESRMLNRKARTEDAGSDTSCISRCVYLLRKTFQRTFHEIRDKMEISRVEIKNLPQDWHLQHVCMYVCHCWINNNILLFSPFLQILQIIR